MLEVWKNGGLPKLNVAAICGVTQTLGPGLRGVIWVQGCPFRCSGCIAPDWIPVQVAQLISPKDLAEQMLQRPEINGLTFSGGEPMRQAAGLAEVAKIVRRKRDFSIICFTGYTLAQLQKHPPGPGVPELLAELDVLIDGQYQALDNDNLGLRGSSNQQLHYLTSRHRKDRLESQPRQVEFHFQQNYALLVGVPPIGVEQVFESVLEKVQPDKLFQQF
jgi:anaerobic ribonucleoside-triphosphate reductase activating protein